MISDSHELREKILLEPVSMGADKLRIITGYSAHTMASWHITEIAKRFDRVVNIDLTVGMCARDMLFRPVHEGFKALTQDSRYKFTCKYITEGSPVHTKIYLWEKDGVPFRAFTGSANYTQPAFFGRHREAMSECDSGEAAEYIDSLAGDSMLCTDDGIKDKIIIAERPPRLIRAKSDNKKISPVSAKKLGAKSVTVSFIVKRTGETATRSGINWGQREGREHNQMYISLPTEIAKSDFFPGKGIHFSVMTDDGQAFILSRGQDSDKGMSTPLNNSLLGRYFRKRLGVPDGAYVRREDFERYGRTDITFYKLDDEQYFMDFSQPEGR